MPYERDGKGGLAWNSRDGTPSPVSVQQVGTGQIPPGGTLVFGFQENTVLHGRLSAQPRDGIMFAPVSVIDDGMLAFINSAITDAPHLLRHLPQWIAGRKSGLMPPSSVSNFILPTGGWPDAIYWRINGLALKIPGNGSIESIQYPDHDDIEEINRRLADGKTVVPVFHKGRLVFDDGFTFAMPGKFGKAVVKHWNELVAFAMGYAAGKKAVAPLPQPPEYRYHPEYAVAGRELDGFIHGCGVFLNCIPYLINELGHIGPKEYISCGSFRLDIPGDVQRAYSLATKLRDDMGPKSARHVKWLEADKIVTLSHCMETWSQFYLIETEKTFADKAGRNILTAMAIGDLHEAVTAIARYGYGFNRSAPGLDVRLDPVPEPVLMDVPDMDRAGGTAPAAGLEP